MGFEMLGQLGGHKGQVMGTPKVVVSRAEFGALAPPADCGHDAVLVPVGPFMVQFPAAALAMGVPMLLVSTPEVPRLSLCMMVLLTRFTFNASCNDIPAPSQPATLLTMMLLEMVTSCQRFGRVLKVATSVPLTDWRRMPPPDPLSAELPWIRLALITKSGPVPSLNPGGQSTSGIVPQVGSVPGVPSIIIPPPFVVLARLPLWSNPI